MVIDLSVRGVRKCHFTEWEHSCDKGAMLGAIVRSLGTRVFGWFLLCLVSLLSLGGCGAETTSEMAATRERSAATSVTLKSIAVTPAPFSLYIQGQQQLTAVGTYSDGSTADVTLTAAWSSNNAVLADVSAKGLVTGVSTGNTTIVAQLGAVKGKATVKVLPTLSSIAITPAKIKLAANATQALSAMGYYSNATTKDLTSGVTWTSSDPAVAYVSGAGLLVAVTPGTATISATTSSASPSPVTGTAAVTVSTATLASLAVTPVTKQLPKGTSQQLSVTGTFSDRTTQDLTAPVVTWSSSAPAVATVNADGLVSAVGTGVALVTARHVASGITDTATITVTAAKLTAVTVTPVNPALYAGLVQPLAATGTFSDGTTLDVTAQVAWISSATDIATVASDGTVTALTPGAATITATDAKTKKTGSTLLTVNPAVIRDLAITPASPSTQAGTSLQVTATGTFTDGTVRDVTASVTWSSSNPAVADISNVAGSAGLVSAFVTGNVEIDAVDATTGIGATTFFVVTHPALRQIVVSPPTLDLDFGRQQPLTATAIYADNSSADVSFAVTWSSSNPNVVRVTPNTGVVLGVSSGSAQVVALDPATGLSGRSLVTVVNVPLRNIVITPSRADAYVGGSVGFGAIATYVDGSRRDFTTDVTWSSDSPNVVVSNAAGSNGLAAAVAEGQAQISALEPTTGLHATALMTVRVLTCQQGFIACGLECKNAQVDLQNCGGCGNVCGTTCYAGQCALTVTNANDAGPGSLRDAVADVPPGGPVVFDPSLFGQTITVSSPIVIDHGAALLGPPGNTVKLSGGGTSQILSITGGPVTLANLTLEDGYSEGNGGAVDNCLTANQLTVTACSFVDNHCVGQSCFGGAVCSLTGGDFFEDDFIGNSATYYGGGIATRGASGSMFMQRLRFIGNSATYGGGMAVYGIQVGQLQNALFAQNYASGAGGALLTQGSPNFLLIQSDVVGNSSGIATISSETFVNSSAITGNSGPALSVYNGGSFNVTYSDFWNDGGFQDTPDPGTTNGNLAADPLFVDTSATSALDWSLHLAPGSPLIDAGDPEVPDADGTRRDIGYYAGPIPPSH
jgi:predicted outer membrane repeat protein